MKIIFTSIITLLTIFSFGQVPTENIIFAHDFAGTFNTAIPEGLEPFENSGALSTGPQMDEASALELVAGQYLLFPNEFSQGGTTSGQLSVSLKFKADLDFVYSMPDYSYANLFNSGDCFIRIQKTSIYFIQVGLFNDNDGFDSYGYITSNTEVNPDQLGLWNTITMTYFGNPLEQVCNLYLNGQLANSTPHGNDCTQGGNVIYLNSNLFIGDNGTQPYGGKIDEIYIHDRTLTPQEVMNIYFSQSFVGVNEIEKNDLKLYPNPVSNILNLEGTSNESIDIINAQGAKVMTKKMTIGQNQWDLNTLPAGIYFIKTSQGSTKFVKA